jgi:hypothetical protein
LPGVDVEARLAVAGPEAAVIVYQHYETGAGEHPRELVQTVLADAGKAGRHRDRRSRSRHVGDEQPAT